MQIFVPPDSTSSISNLYVHQLQTNNPNWDKRGAISFAIYNLQEISGTCFRKLKLYQTRAATAASSASIQQKKRKENLVISICRLISIMCISPSSWCIAVVSDYETNTTNILCVVLWIIYYSPLTHITNYICIILVAAVK